MAFSSIDFWQTELHMLSFYDKSDTLFRLNCPNHGISDFVFLHFRSRDSYPSALYWHAMFFVLKMFEYKGIGYQTKQISFDVPKAN